MALIDQYGNPAPDDLVELDDELLEVATDEQIRQIDQLAWYEYQKKFFNSPILVSLAALGAIDTEFGFIGDDEMYEPFSDNAELVYIDQVLHRYNPVDGWYHA